MFISYGSLRQAGGYRSSQVDTPFTHADELIATKLPLRKTSVRDLRCEHVDVLDLWRFSKQL